MFSVVEAHSSAIVFILLDVSDTMLWSVEKRKKELEEYVN
jgi:hypothetical protein